MEAYMKEYFEKPVTADDISYFKILKTSVKIPVTIQR